MRDLKFALRQLLKHPGFTAVAVLTLALGIGANTAIFSLIDAVLLRMLPVQNPQQLVLLNWTIRGDWPAGIMENISGAMLPEKNGSWGSTSFSYPTYEQIRTRNRVFSGVSALAGNRSELNVGYQGEPGRASGELVSGTFFPTLGIQPVLGRMLSPEDDRAGATPAAVISYGYWERRFGRDPGVIGRTITVNSSPFGVVGVTPPDFYGVQPGRAVEVWLPLHAQPQVEPGWGSLFNTRMNWWLVVMARLSPGVTEAKARADVEVILQQSIAADVKSVTKPETIPHLGVEPGSRGLSELRQRFSKPLSLLMVVVTLVLFIACANVANLMLARASFRRKEFAVRLAIGAGRGRLVRQLLTESVLLAGLGGAVGLVLAFWGTDLLVAFMASGRGLVHLQLTPDPRVLAFTAVVSGLTGVLFGLLPALRSTRIDVTPMLKESTGDLRAPGQARRGLWFGFGQSLVAAQVALTLVLVVVAGLFVRTLTNLRNVKTGFNEQNLLLFGIDPTQDGIKGQRLAEFYRELSRRMSALPGVRSVSVAQNTLIGGGANSLRVQLQRDQPGPGAKDDGVAAYVNSVGPGFFETLEIPLVLGRSFGERDAAGTPKVGIVNEQFVHQFLGGANPIGRRFGFGDKRNSGDFEIVGVVGNTKYNNLRRDPPPTVYVCCLQDLDALGALHCEVRTAGSPVGIVSAIRRVVQGLDSNLALYSIQSQVQQINQTLFQERLFARLTGFFGMLAALLASVGIYGIVSFDVTCRTREIGVRMALGAGSHQIAGMVLRETFVVVMCGILLGIALALGASRLLATLLYGLQPNDPLTLAGAAQLLVMTAALAAYLPARRASRVDPMEALRNE